MRELAEKECEAQELLTRQPSDSGSEATGFITLSELLVAKPTTLTMHGSFLQAIGCDENC